MRSAARNTPDHGTGAGSGDAVTEERDVAERDAGERDSGAHPESPGERTVAFRAIRDDETADRPAAQSASPPSGPGSEGEPVVEAEDAPQSRADDAEGAEDAEHAEDTADHAEVAEDAADEPGETREPGETEETEETDESNDSDGDRVRSFPMPEPVSAALTEALNQLRTAVKGLHFGLDVPGSEEARKAQAAVLAQLDDYVIPRVHMSTAPALIAIAGSTGAGKSTIVNSLAGGKVSATGVRRPTTATPVIVCHPDDHEWYAQGDLLGGLQRLEEPTRDAPAKQRGADVEPVPVPGNRPARHARHRLGRGGTPRDRAPHAGRRRRVGVRHHGVPVRRRAVLGPAAPGQGTRGAPGHRAVPGAAEIP